MNSDFANFWARRYFMDFERYEGHCVSTHDLQEIAKMVWEACYDIGKAAGYEDGYADRADEF